MGSMYKKDFFKQGIAYMWEHYPELGLRIDLAESLIAFEPIGDLWSDARWFFYLTGRDKDIHRFSYRAKTVKQDLVDRLRLIAKSNDETYLDLVNRSTNLESFILPNLEIEVIERILSAKDNGAPKF